MPNFVKSFIGRIAGTPDGSDPFIFNIVRKALAGFDKVEGGLSRAAATYVCTGEGSAVLLTLQQKSPKAIEHLPLQAVYRSVGGAKWSLISILANKDYWDPALILRLGQVFGAAATSLTNATWGYCGTMAGPMWLRLLLTATERGARYDGVFNSDGPQFGEFTVSRCRELLRLAEEPDDGLIDILFHRSATGYQDNHCLDALPGAEDYLRNEPEAVIAAAGILDAKGRIEMLRAIGRLGLTDTYLDYVFAQGIGSAKSTREAALPALHGAGADRLLEKAAEVFESGAPSARGHVANLIASALKEERAPAPGGPSRDGEGQAGPRVDRDRPDQSVPCRRGASRNRRRSRSGRHGKAGNGRESGGRAGQWRLHRTGRLSRRSASAAADAGENQDPRAALRPAAAIDEQLQ